jgi:hypothetical protein
LTQPNIKLDKGRLNCRRTRRCNRRRSSGRCALGPRIIAQAAGDAVAGCLPAAFLFSVTDFNSYVTRSIAPDAPRRVGGRLAAGTAPGPGVTPDPAMLGAPALVV